MTIEEVAQGVHRIESDLGPRFMCQFLLVGDERTLLVDTGLPETPAEALEPAFERVGAVPDLVLVSHADLDHSGGKRRLRELHPRALFACHELDRRWIESSEAMVRENYLWHEPYGFEEPGEEGRRDLLALCGGDAPVDLGLRGGETLRLDAGWRVEVLHLPGHTLGHLGVWDQRSRAAIVIDAALADGIYDRAGTKLIPPRYYDAAAYRSTIRRIRALEPELLLTSHYPVMGRAEAREWLEGALAFTDRLEACVREGFAAGVTDLWELTKRADAELGPFPEFMTELGAAVRSHLP